MSVLDLPTGRLTKARRSVWDAIENWPALADLFQAKFRFESKIQDGRLVEPAHRPDAPTSPSELPAIAIMPSAVTPKWATNLQKDHPYALDIVYWTPGRCVDLSESIWDELIKAFYQSKPPGNLDIDTYIKEGTGYAIPVGEGPSKISFVKLGRDGKVEATQHIFQLVLRMKITPRGATL